MTLPQLLPLRATPRYSGFYACRWVAGRRISQNIRSFRTTSLLCNDREKSTDKANEPKPTSSASSNDNPARETASEQFEGAGIRNHAKASVDSRLGEIVSNLQELQKEFHRSLYYTSNKTDEAKTSNNSQRQVTKANSKEISVDSPEEAHSSKEATNNADSTLQNIASTPEQSYSIENSNQFPVEDRLTLEDAIRTTFSIRAGGRSKPSNRNEQGLDQTEASGRSHGGKKSSKTSDSGFHGSAKKRALRNLPEAKVYVPSWFIDKNIRLHGEPAQTHVEAIYPVDEKDQGHACSAYGSSDSPSSDNMGHFPEKHSRSSSNETTRGTYQISKALLDEINFSISAGLRFISATASDIQSGPTPHVVLQSPKEGAEIFLDSIVKQVADTLEADTVSINAQDIAEITAQNAWLFPSGAMEPFKFLGFETHVVPEENDPFADEAENDDEGQEDVEDMESWTRPGMDSFSAGNSSKLKPSSLPKALQSLLPGAKFVRVVGAVPFAMSPNPNKPFHLHIKPDESGESIANSSELSGDDMYSSIIETFLDCAQLKTRQTRETKPITKDSDAENDKPASGNELILHIKDYLEIKATRVGGTLLSKIHQVVDRRRRLGQRIIIVGTSSASDLIPSLSKSGFKAIQDGSYNNDCRTIVTPCKSPDVDAIFTEDAKYVTTVINCRNILNILQRGAWQHQLSKLSLDDDLGFASDQIFAWGLNETVWSLDHVQRMTNIVLGMVKHDETITHEHLDGALQVIESSDDSKFKWLDTQKEKESNAETKEGKHIAKKLQDTKLKALHKTCNRYEKRLLNGVVDAQSINTTFNDVQVSADTIEALKTLTSLSLVRPDAFKYGVLATDKIPGLLLYGPPGTGKTLLAKAVARESGATVLEVAGSDVFDKYVGEGEKNVKAIFTLAKKLSPCVVFIDEADAIFGSRNNFGNRSSHRELINQFLREWDGMNTLSAFIMVATNRPYDLDDAVLRRLPRRLLVDLPTEKDRELILGIHLKDELLAPDVSLSLLASRTPFYSGSDLKNLSVAAALACVREENEAAARHTGEEPYKHPDRRTITKEHFEQAMQEISASISDDMSSLTAIRKFDEKYGDRKGRKKKSGGLGFGTLTEKEREKLSQEESRIRNTDTKL